MGTNRCSWIVWFNTILCLWFTKIFLVCKKKVKKTIEYKIKKGKHRSNKSGISLTFKDVIEGECYFRPSCFYLEESNDKYDINKLVGLSAYFFHHIESVRIGFRTNTEDLNLMDLFVYAYDDKVRVKEIFICSVKPYEKFTYRVEITPSRFIVRVNDIENDVIRSKKNYSILKYRLFPYYGGNQKAKQDMHIVLKFI